MVHDEYHHVGPAQRLQGLLHPQLPHSSFVVNARRIGDDAWTQAVNLQSLAHGIGGRARMGRDDGGLLAHEGIEQRRFAAVALSHERDVQSGS